MICIHLDAAVVVVVVVVVIVVVCCLLLLFVVVVLLWRGFTFEGIVFIILLSKPTI